jgi:hypothetical protein
MEIHSPKGPILSVRHLLVELATITLGILIALSLEALTGWFHHRTLVREARANIQHEIADNKKELDNAIANIPDSERDLQQALGFVSDLLGKRKPGLHTLRFNYIIAQLNATSRTTAEATGALGYMEYSEVKTYAAAYEGQQQFERLQERLLDAFVPLLNATHEADPAKADERELLEWKDRILTSLSYLQTEAIYGKSVSRKFDAVLAMPR